MQTGYPLFTSAVMYLNRYRPDILFLFEDWQERWRKISALDGPESWSYPIEVAQKLGLLARGAAFIVTKLKREEKTR